MDITENLMNKNIMDSAIKHELYIIARKSLESIKGYELAIEKVQSDDLRTYFEDKKRKRNQFLTNLELLSQIHIDRTIGDSFASSLYRSWIDFKTFFWGNEEEVMITESLKGDQSTLWRYDQLLAFNSFPSKEIDSLLSNQRDELVKEIDQLRNLIPSYL